MRLRLVKLDTVSLALDVCCSGCDCIAGLVLGLLLGLLLGLVVVFMVMVGVRVRVVLDRFGLDFRLLFLDDLGRMLLLVCALLHDGTR